MIHDIAPQVFDNSYRKEEPDAESFIIFTNDNAALVRETEQGIAFPRLGEIPPSRYPYTYLFAIDSDKFFLAPAASPWGDYAYCGMMELRGKRPKAMAFAAATACQLSGWYESNRFCGACGADMSHDGKERMLRCENCGNMVYPRISPAVIVAVTDGDRLLLTKYAGRLYKNYALIAGFTEIGEPIEDTVRREVYEEAGVRVKNIRYYKSQPWPFSGSLLMGFYCDLDGSDIITIDENELSSAEWMRREHIGVMADGISLTNEMIMNFKERRV